MAKRIEKGFHSSFRTFGGGSFDPQNWERYFLKYSSQEWEEEGDGVIGYHGAANLLYSVVIIHVPQDGFVIQNECHNRTTNRNVWCKFGVESINQLSEFVNIGDEFLYPKGCLLQPANAWKVVKDFLQYPTADTRPICMVDDGEIDWPEF